MSTTIITTNTLTANDADIEDVEDADDGSVEEETSPDIPARRTRSRGPARSPGPLPGSSRRRATLTEDIPDLPLDQPEVPAEQPPPEGGPGLDYAAISQTLVRTVQQRNARVSELEQQLQILIRQNQALMDDHDRTVRLFTRPEPTPTVPAILEPPEPTPARLPLPPGPAPSPTPAPRVTQAQYASTMSSLLRPPEPRLRREVTPEEMRQTAGSALRGLMTSNTTTTPLPNPADLRVPGNTIYHVRPSAPEVPPPHHPSTLQMQRERTDW